MKAPRSDLLTAFQSDELLAKARDIIDDADIRTSITYVQLTGTSYDVQTGAETPTETSDTVNAVRRDVTQREVDRSGGSLQIGDRVYLVDQADLTNEPVIEDRITDGDTYEVYQYRGDTLGLVWVIWARKV